MNVLQHNRIKKARCEVHHLNIIIISKVLTVHNPVINKWQQTLSFIQYARSFLNR